MCLHLGIWACDECHITCSERKQVWNEISKLKISLRKTRQSEGLQPTVARHEFLRYYKIIQIGSSGSWSWDPRSKVGNGSFQLCPYNVSKGSRWLFLYTNVHDGSHSCHGWVCPWANIWISIGSHLVLIYSTLIYP